MLVIQNLISKLTTVATNVNYVKNKIVHFSYNLHNS